jgi:putative toxin-antitoxin system antitoxin component (TIGR02293 family)
MKSLTDTLDFVGVEPASSPGQAIALRFSAVEQLGQRMHVDAAALFDLMGIPERTRSRRRHDGFLKPDEADRLLRIARVFGEAIRVFGSEEKAVRWLKTPSPLFEESAPLAYLDSDGGAHAVSEEIVRIDFGDFA